MQSAGFGLTEFDFDGARYVIDGSEVLLKQVYITDKVCSRGVKNKASGTEF